MKVIYVMGAARSGSTILGVTLGNCENIFYAGELGKWLVKSGISSVRSVRRSQRARFWSTVRANVEEAEDLFGEETQDVLEKSQSLFRVHKWPMRRQLRDPYRRIAEDLYFAIGRAAGVTHIVDTSSLPLRARQVQQLDKIDLYLVFLVRDPQRVVASFADPVSQFSKSKVVTNAYIWLTNMLSMFVFLRHPRDRRLFVRYEDFIANPRSTIGHILRIVDLPAAVPDLSRLSSGIPFEGNRRVIRQEEVSLRDHDESPPSTSLLTGLVQLPWRALLSRMRPIVQTGLDESIVQGEAGQPERSRTRNSDC
jgi:Sulfotransferase family